MFIKADKGSSDAAELETQEVDVDSEADRKQSPMHTRVNILKTIVGAGIFVIPLTFQVSSQPPEQSQKPASISDYF
jgi:hypothetical protein